MSSELDGVLCPFYLGVRNKKGEPYRRASYLAARAAISRHVAVDLKLAEMNIFRHPQIRRSNDDLDRHLKQKKKQGHEPSVEQGRTQGGGISGGSQNP